MTDINNQTQAIQQEQPRIITMPETPEQLKAFVAATLNELFHIPENATMLASVVLNGFGKAIRNDAERLQRDMARPIIVSGVFPGCIKAIIGMTDGDVPVLTVSFQGYVDGVQWVALENVDPAKIERLRELVLTRANAPGEVFYITTSQAVDAAADQVADLFQKANGVDPVV